MRLRLALAFVLVACVPADEAIPTGSAQFTIFAKDEDLFLSHERFVALGQGWDIEIERAMVSFKTMTIGKVGVADQCSYRGRGARNNVLFDLSRGNVQTFNGIQPGDCPDVGLVLGIPDLATTLGEGTTVADIGAMVAAPASHFIIAGRAIPATPRFAGDRPSEPYRFYLRFDPARTTTSYGGCRDTMRGVHIVPEERQRANVTFNPAAIFRQAIAPGVPLDFRPFARADIDSNDDKLVTMDELDQVKLSSVRQGFSQLYVLPDGQLDGTFGDFVRAQLRFVFQYGESGVCNGNPPGVQ